MTFLLAFWRPIAILLAIVALAAGIGVAKHGYDEGKRLEGDARTTKVLQPKLNDALARADVAEGANRKLTADLGRIKVEVQKQNADIASYQAAVAVAQKEAQAALAKVAATSQRYTAEVARLTAIATAQRVTEDDCVQAKQILADVARASAASVRDD